MIVPRPNPNFLIAWLKNLKGNYVSFKDPFNIIGLHLIYTKVSESPVRDLSAFVRGCKNL
jgi:hypothetical protein